MRLRNIRGSEEIIASSKWVVKEPEALKGKWNQYFKNENPIRIEIGMGKGKFITELAKENPEVNYIGIEKYTSVLLRAVQKLQDTELSNLCFLCVDADEITEFFDTEEIDRIYLNFSDPWPKDRHAKRRLTSRQFLERYDKILKRDGRLEFKTDNDILFAFSLEEIPEAGWILDKHTFHLHQDAEMAKGNIMTEYEEKFSSLGNPIHKLIASRKR